jgi:hypothetical protein
MTWSANVDPTAASFAFTYADLIFLVMPLCESEAEVTYVPIPG